MRWLAAREICKLANENLDILGVKWSEHVVAWLEGEVLPVLPPFKRIRTMIEMVNYNAPHEWANILKGIISAVREVEERLGPQLERGVVSSQPGAFVVIQPSAPSEAEFTERTRTAVSRSNQEQHVFQGGSVTNNTWEDSLGETANLPETMPGGDLLRECQQLEDQLQEQRQNQGNENNHTIASTLHDLGAVKARNGLLLKEARQLLQESLQMRRSLLADQDHPEIAKTLYELANVTTKAEDFDAAVAILQECLRMQQSLHDNQAHPDILSTLHQLSNVFWAIGDLKKARQSSQEGLRMAKSLTLEQQVNTKTLRELAKMSKVVRDFKQAEEYLQASLEIDRYIHGDQDRRLSIAHTLSALGQVSRQTGNLNQAGQHFKESLQVLRSLHGDQDHPDIAAVLYERGVVRQQTEHLKEAMLDLKECLQMQRSCLDDPNHLEIARVLLQLGMVSRLERDFENAEQYLLESLRIFNIRQSQSEIAIALHELGVMKVATEDHNTAFQYLQAEQGRTNQHMKQLKLDCLSV